jgi:flagellar basal body-associated protein FliL
MTEASAADRRDMDAEDTKKSKKDKWKNFFTPSNPDLWIALGVIAVVIILVCLFVVVVAVLCVLFVCVCIRKQKQRYSSNITQHNK